MASKKKILSRKSRKTVTRKQAAKAPPTKKATPGATTAKSPAAGSAPAAGGIPFPVKCLDALNFERRQFEIPTLPTILASIEVTRMHALNFPVSDCKKHFLFTLDQKLQECKKYAQAMFEADEKAQSAA